MDDILLFKAAGQRYVSKAEFSRLLEDLLIPQTEILFLHTGMSFGLPNPAIKRMEFLRHLYEAIAALHVPTLCVPTFTFSYCNGQEFDVQNTRSRMGALNEYIRQLPGAIRSIDPLLSVALVGEHADLVTNIGKYSIGEKSFYHNLSKQRHVTFLFLGTEVGACFTYMHFLEERAKVPYRYNREFTGYTINNGKRYEDTYTLFVRYNNVTPNRRSYDYQDRLKEAGHLRFREFGDGQAMSIDKDVASAVYLELLGQDPNYFITDPFDPAAADSTFEAHDMVAL